MEAQSYTAQERRAANQVWAAAGAYGFEPLFLAHNTDGTVDFYMNTIVGLVHKYYGDKLINSIFDRWAGDLRQARHDRAANRVRRAGVWVVLPLGCCFLPAFLLVTVVPLVVALVAGRA